MALATFAIAPAARAEQLTAANLVKLCFPEIKEPSEDPVSDVVDLVDKWDDEMNTCGDECKYPEDGDSMTEAMKSTGCSVEEAEQIAKGKLQLPNVPYFSSGTLGLQDGPEAARKAASLASHALCGMKRREAMG